MKQYVENFNGTDIRMIQDEDGTIWAVLRDVMAGLGRINNNEIARAKEFASELYGVEGVKSFNILVGKGKRKQTQEHLCIIEDAIYNIIGSNRPNKFKQKNCPDALEKWKSFNRFISNLIKGYRKTHNFGIFEMYDKEHQKQQMERVKNTLEDIEKQEKAIKIDSKNYAVINKQVNQIVCEYLKIDYCKKESMTLEQRKFRIKILKDYVDTYEQTQSKGTANALIRYKYRLKQKGTGNKIFKAGA